MQTHFPEAGLTPETLDKLDRAFNLWREDNRFALDRGLAGNAYALLLALEAAYRGQP